MQTRFKPMRGIGWTTTISANPTFSGRLLGISFDSGMGTHPAVAPHLEPRSISPGLFKSDRASERTDNGRFDLPSEQPTMPAPFIAWIFARGPRSEKYVERGIQRDAAVAVVCFDECVLRFGVHQRNAGRAISRKLFAAAHHV